MVTEEHHALPEEYHDTFAEMLYEIGQARKIVESTLTSFWPLRGEASSASAGALYVGRAVNGWGEPFTQAEIATREGARQQARAAYAEAQRTRTTWVTEYSGEKLGSDGKRMYNTNRSPFWCAIRDIAQLTGSSFSETAWPAALSWSNLYKVSSADGGNPSERLRRAQFQNAAKLLRMEVEAWRPASVVVIAQEGWWKAFADALEIQVAPQGGGAVEAVGEKFGAGWVFAVRPEGRQRGRYVADVTRAMQSGR